MIMISSSFKSPKSYLYAHNLKNRKAALLRYVISIQSTSILYHKLRKSPVFLHATVYRTSGQLFISAGANCPLHPCSRHTCQTNLNIPALDSLSSSWFSDCSSALFICSIRNSANAPLLAKSWWYVPISEIFPSFITTIWWTRGKKLMPDRGKYFP